MSDGGIRQTQNTHCSLSSRTRKDAVCVCEMPLFMHELDGSEGEDSPPRVKRTRCVFLRPPYKNSSACADALVRRTRTST